MGLSHLERSDTSLANNFKRVNTRLALHLLFVSL